MTHNGDHRELFTQRFLGFLGATILVHSLSGLMACGVAPSGCTFKLLGFLALPNCPGREWTTSWELLEEMSLFASSCLGFSRKVWHGFWHDCPRLDWFISSSTDPCLIGVDRREWLKLQLSWLLFLTMAAVGTSYPKKKKTILSVLDIRNQSAEQQYYHK